MCAKRRYKLLKKVFGGGAASSPLSQPTDPTDPTGPTGPTGPTEELQLPEASLSNAAHSSNAAEPCVLPSSSTVDAPESQERATTEAEAKSTAAEGVPAAGATQQQGPAPSKSQELWNEAYDSLADDEDTAQLVRSYVNTLEKAFGNKPEATVAKISDELRDPTKRQMHMRKLVEEGREKISMEPKIAEGVGNVAQFILSAKGMVDAAIQNIPQAALPWAGVCVALQILLNPAQAKKSKSDGIAYVVSRMDWYCALAEYLLEPDYLDESLKSTSLELLKEKIIALYKALLIYQMKSACSYYRQQGFVFLRDLVNLDDWDASLKTVTSAEDAFLKDSGQYNKLHTNVGLSRLVKIADERKELLGDIRQTLQDLHLDSTDRECRWALRVIDPRDDIKKIENKKDELLDSAYIWILKRKQYAAFTQWGDDQPGTDPCRLLWIKGYAGTGKTMLLIGILRELEKQSVTNGPCLSYFFCQDTDATLNNATVALRSLVWMLLVAQPHLISHLRERYNNSGSRLFEDANAFFALSEVFRRMLKDPDLSPVYFVVDALDECNQAKPGRDDLIRLISESLALSNKIKWLVSSRPEVALGARTNIPGILKGLVELDSQTLQEPVYAYINHRLSTLKTIEGYDDETLAQVAEEVRIRATNTFLWVALVFKELESVAGYDAVETVRKIPSGLLKLYDYMMVRIEEQGEPQRQRSKNILAATFLAYRPLSLPELAAVSGLPEKADPQTIVERCGSFLTIMDGTVYPIHQSARDWLSENFTSRIQPAGIPQGHADISERSLNAMSSALKRNMYNLDFDSEPKDIDPPEPDPLAPIRYSCVFWANHLFQNGESPECQRALADGGAVLAFLREHFLHWLESLSLLGKLREGGLAVTELFYVVQKHDPSSRLAAFLREAQRIARDYEDIIARAPLQAYGPTIAFCPTTSEVRNAHWEQRLPFIKTITRTEDIRDAYCQRLEGHGGRVHRAAFSPDGRMLASASADHTIWLWDTATGVPQQILHHDDSVRIVAFSPDGRILASASSNRTVQLWDAATGAPRQTFEYNDWVEKVAFSPDGRILASTLDDRTVRLLDLASGVSLQTFEHSEDIWGIAFLPDSQTLVSALNTYVQLSDIVTGTPRKTFKYKNSCLTAALSLDGQMLALASHPLEDGDYAVRLWDIATGKCKQELENENHVFDIVFSPNGQTLALETSDWLELWDIATGMPRQRLRIEGHALAFSPNGQTVVSASLSGDIVWLWDWATDTPRKTSEGHDDAVGALAFSPDGKTLASGSEDSTVRLWDVATGTLLKTLEGHGPVGALAFSPDGKTLASGSYDDTARLWHVATGTLRKTLEGHSRIVCTVAFSPDGHTLASGSYDDTARLWDVATGTLLETLEGHSDSVHAVAFSPDGQTLASGSYDDTARLWDVATGTLLETLEGHSDLVHTVAFSPDGQTLASGSRDQTARLWDVATGTHRETLECGHTIWDLRFSEDGQYLETNTGLLRVPLQSTPTKRDLDKNSNFLCINDNWVIRDGKALLRLHFSEYHFEKVQAVASYGNCIVTGHESGRLTFFHFEFQD